MDTQATYTPKRHTRSTHTHTHPRLLVLLALSVFVACSREARAHVHLAQVRPECWQAQGGMYSTVRMPDANKQAFVVYACAQPFGNLAQETGRSDERALFGSKCQCNIHLMTNASRRFRLGFRV